MDKLPKVFANKIDKEINNVQELYYGQMRESVMSKEINVIKKINNIFSSSNHVYKSKVSITTKDNKVEKVIVGKNLHNLITIDGELINIDSILDIVKI